MESLLDAVRKEVRAYQERVAELQELIEQHGVAVHAPARDAAKIQELSDQIEAMKADLEGEAERLNARLNKLQEEREQGVAALS